MQLLNEASPNTRALSAYSLAELEYWAEVRGLPRYRARQLWAALNRRGLQDVSELTEFPLDLRERIGSEWRMRTLKVRTHLRSPADGAEKVLFALHDGATVESVLIPGRNAGGGSRQTVCVSSQVGCPAACSFCATGLAGFTRNLSPTEICDQVMYFGGRLRARGLRVTNVVFMGMGEPLLNVPAVREALARLSDPNGFGLGARHVTISTVGIVPQIRALREWAGQANLAISLHAPNDELRSTLVPYNQHFPIADLMAATGEYIERTNRRVSIEYVLLRGVNDDIGLARELVTLLSPFRGLIHVNLIPWNPFQEGRFARSEGPDAESFAAALNAGRINATIRYSRGLDISAACGQLRELAGA